jgi:hypothetical protein
VVEAEAETGPPLLHKAAEDNTAGTFHVTFQYKILSRDVEVIRLETPVVVQLTVPPPEMIIDHVRLGLGSWKAQLRSAHGKSPHIFKLPYSGPNDDWLDGNAVGPKGESEEIDFGHKRLDFLAFTITLNQPDGQRVKSFLLEELGTKSSGHSWTMPE